MKRLLLHPRCRRHHRNNGMRLDHHQPTVPTMPLLCDDGKTVKSHNEMPQAKEAETPPPLPLHATVQKAMTVPTWVVVVVVVLVVDWCKQI